MPYQVQYPTNYELKLLEPDLIQDAMLTADPIFQQFPITSKPVSMVEWIIRENIKGLQAARGYDGQLPRIQNLGANLLSMIPGVYGEQSVIGERELTTRAPYNAPGAVINVDDIVVERQKILITREVSRIRVNIWTLLTMGIFSVYAPGTNALQHAGQYDIRSANTSTDTSIGMSGAYWSDASNANPIVDLLAMKVNFEKGTSCRFGSGSSIFMNQKTYNYILNSSKIGTRIFAGKNLLPSAADVANLFANYELGKPVVVNDGYLDDNNVWHYYVPDGYAVAVGTRPNNDMIGEYIQTRNANDPNMAPGPFIKVIDDPDKTPRNIEIHRGHNGGPAIYYPNGVVTMKIAA